MPQFPPQPGGVIRTLGATVGTSSVATALMAGTSGAKGTPVQLTAATEFETNWVEIRFTDIGTGGAAYLVDILADSATETVIIPDLFATAKNAGPSFGQYLFPIQIPKGTRLAAQCASSTNSATIRISVTLFSGGMFTFGGGPSWVSAYGSVTNQLGTNVDPGGVADTDSAWVEIAAATDRAHNWLCLSGRFSDITLAAVTYWRVQIGIGANPNEKLIVPDIHFSSDASADQAVNAIWQGPCYVPSGSRLSVKVRSSSITDSDRDIWVKIYGV